MSLLWGVLSAVRRLVLRPFLVQMRFYTYELHTRPGVALPRRYSHRWWRYRWELGWRYACVESAGVGLPKGKGKGPAWARPLAF